jgi:hypothetical protein
MFHPLAPNLSEVSSDDLQKKYGELSSRMSQALRFGPSSAVPQLQMLMAHYQDEISRRNQKQLEELEKTSKKFKGIIDIK